ncbi:MAG: DUF255 domain-containing protein [Candidatus Eisenbacteria bacterium]|nr:DUF255 domain-containing protein [Candidatus Eisenbacteria bacterium]MCC7141221.1 DUF255 domain-containing protein [Candidatus Eisenbacteria bacterium]
MRRPHGRCGDARRWVVVLGATAALAASLCFAPGRVRGEGTTAAPAPASEIDWAENFGWALEEARAEDKVVMVDFFTHWCHWCKVLDKKTYVDPTVCRTAERMVSVKVNAESEVAVASKYGVRAYPTIAFLNPDGSLRRLIQGYMPPDQFQTLLEEVLNVDAEVEDLIRRVDRKPQDEVSRAALAELLSLAGRHGAAEAQLDTLLLLPAVEPEARVGYQLDRCLAIARQGRLDEAREAIESWLDTAEASPRRPEAEFYLARMEAGVGRSKQAKKLFERITKVRPGTWFAFEASSWIAEASGKPKKGQEAKKG